MEMPELFLQTIRMFMDAPTPDKILILMFVFAVCLALFLMLRLLQD